MRGIASSWYPEGSTHYRVDLKARRRLDDAFFTRSSIADARQLNQDLIGAQAVRSATFGSLTPSEFTRSFTVSMACWTVLCFQGLFDQRFHGEYKASKSEPLSVSLRSYSLEYFWYQAASGRRSRWPAADAFNALTASGLFGSGLYDLRDTPRLAALKVLLNPALPTLSVSSHSPPQTPQPAKSGGLRREDRDRGESGC
jgi:hypothetical protein